MAARTPSLTRLIADRLKAGLHNRADRTLLAVPAEPFVSGGPIQEATGSLAILSRWPSRRVLRRSV